MLQEGLNVAKFLKYSSWRGLKPAIAMIKGER